MDWVHLHLALNHVPVLGTPFLLGLLLWSWGRRQKETVRFCLWLFVTLSAVSVAIKFTGDFAAEAIGKRWPEVSARAIEQHEQSADQATTGVFFVGVGAIMALVLSRAGRPAPGWCLALLSLLALLTFALMARTANFGGHIRHPEIRPHGEAQHGGP